MAKGGRREGAGRKVGSKARVSAEQRARALLHGAAPRDVLLKVMRHYDKVFDKLVAEGDKLIEEHKAADVVAEHEAKVKDIAVLVADFASKTAPYLHAKLSAIDITPKVNWDLLTPEEIGIVAPILEKCVTQPADFGDPAVYPDQPATQH